MKDTAEKQGLTCSCEDADPRHMGGCDAWICRCGNTGPDDGFSPCDRNGNEVEPTVEDWPIPLVVCNKCETIYITNDDGTVSVAMDGLALAKRHAERFRILQAAADISAAVGTIATILSDEGGVERYESVIGGPENPFGMSFDEFYLAVMEWEDAVKAKLDNA